MCAASPATLPIPPASSARPRRRTQAFGNVHVVCNNAGVAGGGGIDNISLDNWRWVLDVNLMGVLHGIRTFLPHIRAHGEGGHIVNTASMAGMNSGLGFSPYSASKFAVVDMSEGLATQLKPLGIGVTVLCPGFVRTRISESGRNRPRALRPDAGAGPRKPGGPAGRPIAELRSPGSTRRISPRRSSPRSARTNSTCSRIRKLRAELKERFAAILAAMDKAAAR